jgi:hypothetical protein
MTARSPQVLAGAAGEAHGANGAGCLLPNGALGLPPGPPGARRPHPSARPTNGPPPNALGQGQEHSIN